MRNVAVLLCLALFSGCAHERFTAGSGEAGHFILRQAIAHGARPVSTNTLPRIGGNWIYFQDEDGVIMHLPYDRFTAVEVFLRQAFGNPSIPVADTTDGGKLGVYGVKAIGASIQFGYNKEGTFVNILRPISAGELADHLPKAVKENSTSSP